MKKQRAVASGIVRLVAVGAAMTASAAVAAQPSCTGSNHCVDVAIAGGAIAPVPDTVIAAKNHQIYWRIRTSGYGFPRPPSTPRGIAFKPPSAANDNGKMPSKEFPCNRVSATVFHCTDANSTHGTGERKYQYSITVIDKAGHRIVLDPWIVNR